MKHFEIFFSLFPCFKRSNEKHNKSFNRILLNVGHMNMDDFYIKIQQNQQDNEMLHQCHITTKFSAINKECTF